MNSKLGKNWVIVICGPDDPFWNFGTPYIWGSRRRYFEVVGGNDGGFDQKITHPPTSPH